MGVSIRHAGSIKELQACSVRQGGSIKAVQEIWVRRAGVISKVWPTLQTLTFNSSAFLSIIGLQGMQAHLIFSSTGNVFDYACQNTGSGFTCDPASTQHSGIYDSANFIRFTETSRNGEASGSITTPSLNTWLPLDLNRQFVIEAAQEFTQVRWQGSAEISTTAGTGGVFITGPIDVSAYFEGGQ